jgi:hypothetical protein
MMLSQREINCIQGSLESLCNLDCTIKRSTTTGTDDGWNNGTGVPTEVGTTKALKQQPNPALIQAYANRLGTHTAWHMSFPLDADVQERDTLVIDGEEFTAQVKLQGSYDFLLNFLVTEVL